MKKPRKHLTFFLLFGLVATSIGGAVFLPALSAKLVCGALGLLGVLVSVSVYGTSRAEVIEIVETLEAIFLSAEQGECPDTEAFSGEVLTHRLGLRAVRLVEATQSKAQEQESMRAELQSTVSDLAHQLRAPVANLTLYADTLAAGDLPPEKQTEFLAVLGGQAHKLEFLVEALVKTGRLETGAIHMSLKMVPIRDTMEQAAALVKPLAEAKGLAFVFDCADALPLLHDPKWTAEAVFNLLDNAVKYTETGTITLTARRWEMYTCIEVSDTGIGFTQEHAALLFGRFYRAPQTAGTPGIGLGLYIVRQIAQLQGGYVQAKSLDHGSAFRLFLPNTVPIHIGKKV